jgi:hypothetical protein
VVQGRRWRTRFMQAVGANHYRGLKPVSKKLHKAITSFACVCVCGGVCWAKVGTQQLLACLTSYCTELAVGHMIAAQYSDSRKDKTSYCTELAVGHMIAAQYSDSRKDKSAASQREREASGSLSITHLITA